jgi:hypothetical protein
MSALGMQSQTDASRRAGAADLFGTKANIFGTRAGVYGVDKGSATQLDVARMQADSARRATAASSSSAAASRALQERLAQAGFNQENYQFEKEFGLREGMAPFQQLGATTDILNALGQRYDTQREWGTQSNPTQYAPVTDVWGNSAMAGLAAWQDALKWQKPAGTAATPNVSTSGTLSGTVR